jgi:hypothetical protein
LGFSGRRAESWGGSQGSSLMPGSKKTEDGLVIVTTPGASCTVGDRFYVIGQGGEFPYSFPDWLLRVVDPLPPWRGQTSGTPNHELAQERLRESLQNGTVHESLVPDPLEQAA